MNGAQRVLPWSQRLRTGRAGRIPSSARAHRLHAIRVATMATVVVALFAAVIASAFDLIVLNHLDVATDARLAEQLSDVVFPEHLGGVRAPLGDADRDVDEAPVFVWSVTRSGVTHPITAGAPELPRGPWSKGPVQFALAGSEFRFVSRTTSTGWLVAGSSISQTGRVSEELIVAECLLGAVLVLVTFGGSLAVGLRASAPAEEMRRAQSEFTADASHELRTPLTVIQAEVDLALSKPRSTESYHRTLSRIAMESARLRSIVDDLLWLARQDAPHPTSGQQHPFEPVDLARVAASMVQRFEAVADAAGQSLRMTSSVARQTTVLGTEEDIERLIGVLLDNASRYAGQHGTVRVTVTGTGNRVTLSVEDSGPGIPESERTRIFDRFHRVSDVPGGTGLGLAIADVVVRHTHGTWSIGSSSLGGARVSISWRHAPLHPAGRMAHHPGIPDPTANSSGASDRPAATT